MNRKREIIVINYYETQERDLLRIYDYLSDNEDNGSIYSVERIDENNQREKKEFILSFLGLRKHVTFEDASRELKELFKMS